MLEGKDVTELRADLDAALAADDVPSLATAAAELRAQLALRRAADGDVLDVKAIDELRMSANDALAQRLRADVEGAATTEVYPDTPHPVITIIEAQKAILANEGYGGTMRLGAWPCKLAADTRARQAYGEADISERHRHRYEVNNAYREKLTEKGLVLSGLSPDGNLVEMVEIPDHPWFVGCQFHPEFKSKPMAPHPLFARFVAASLAKRG